MLADGVEVDLHGEGVSGTGELHESQGRQPRQLALEGAGRHIGVGGLNVGRDAKASLEELSVHYLAPCLTPYLTA